MKIEILGTGCPKCTKLKNNAEIAAKEMGIDFEIEKIEDINKITSFGVMMTPALVVNGEVKVVGKVPNKEELKKILK